MSVLWQIGLVLGLCLAGQGIEQLLPFAFPASVISLILLFILLVLRWIKAPHVKDVADFMLKNMGFFFIPSTVGVVQYLDLFSGALVRFLAVCILSTIITFAVTAYTVQGVMRLLEKRQAAKSGKETSL